MNQTIKEIYSLNQNNQEAETEYALDKWYARLINKTADEIDLEDVSRMLSQNVFIDLGIEKAMEILSEDPIAGVFYDGQLLELLSAVDLDNVKDLFQLKLLLQKINNNLSNLDWSSEEDQIEYNELLTNFLNKINL
ncbi:contact-dependent growth inhibition system immunity protein [Paenibacillus glucanolyticus]|uniref:contact-dependent growth inhibition system immunity protein n=1 Tax=Paenibacillus glucanolyticus TaxID=59843 RepID=UPI0034CE06A2